MPLLGYLFHDRLRIYGYGFQQFSTYSGYMGIVFLKKIHLFVNFFGNSGFMGMISGKFSGFMGILFRNFSGFMVGIFMI